MDSLLRTFYGNEHERDAVKAFMVETLGEIAKERAFNGEETGGIQEAKECIDKMFETLEERYGIIKPPTIRNSK